MPPPLTNSSSAPCAASSSRTPSTIRGRRSRMSASERRLHEADRGAAQRPARDPVADPGDLALVGHQPGELGPGALGDLGRHPRAPGAASWTGERFGPIRADPAAERPPGDVDVEADADLRGAAADRALDQVEVGAVVDHQHRRPRRVARRSAGRPRRSPPDRRSGRRRRCPRTPRSARCRASGAVNASTPSKARVELEDPPQDRGRAHRLRGHPDRQPAGLREHRRRVATQRVEIDERERWRDAGEDRVVAGLEGLEIGSGARVHGAASVSRLGSVPGEVAEWLKALAC